MIKDKFCPKCQEMHSIYSKYCVDCGTILEVVKNINGVKIPEQPQ